MNYNRIVKVFIAVLVMTIHLNGAVTDELNTAMEDGNSVFLLVTEPNASGVNHARDIIATAMNQVDGSVLIEMDRTVKQNAALIAKYRVGTAPVPLILVIDENGTVAGGNIAAKLTAEKLHEMVPTPKKSEVLKAIQAGNSVFLTISRDSMVDNTIAKNNCFAACQQLKGKSIIVQLDIDDRKEQLFLQQLKVDPTSVEPVTVVFNSKGKVTETFKDIVDVGALVQAATKVSGGCCPKGSGKSCDTKKTK
ncbi:MAG: hypothetical protein HQ510_04055 [Candidatus Marinimicrobia bacterium]|nr:hypothetical protein [Candidatus Neomarinimicrobiota bacterium]